MSNHTLSILVSNKPGVLARVSGLFSRRGYNIESLTVGPTLDEEVSRMTVVATVDNDRSLEQLVKQLNKLIEVYKIVELDSSSVDRELMLVKVHCNESTRTGVIQTIGLFRGRAVDVSAESITIEVTGSPDKLQALIQLLLPYGIIELATSGHVALPRGITDTKQKRRSALRSK